MEQIEKIDAQLHFLMCFTGGFVGGYSILGRIVNFGSAQTTNIMGAVFSLLGKNNIDFTLRLGALLIYMLALAFPVILTHKSTINLKRYAISINVIGLVFLALLPKHMNPVLALYPMFFITATQWSIFHGTNGFNCSTIFSTNNLKQVVLSYTNYFFKRERKELIKGRFFLHSLLSFYIGSGISYVVYLKFEIEAILFCILPMLVAFYLLHREIIIENFVKEQTATNQTIEI